MDGATQYALAYALTTSAGLRGVLTLAVASLAVHMGYLHPPDAFAWLGSTAVTVALVLVALLDFAGDKIPAVDHALHAVNILVKPVCAAILVGGTLHPHSSPELIALMALGVFNALGIHAASATLRGTSTVATAGVANPVVSIAEDAGSIGMLVVAFAAPIAGAAIALALSIALVFFARKVWRAFRAHSAGTVVRLIPFLLCACVAISSCSGAARTAVPQVQAAAAERASGSAYTVTRIPQPPVDPAGYRYGCTNFILAANNVSHFIDEVTCSGDGGSLTNYYLYDGAYVALPANFIGNAINDSDVIAGTIAGRTAARWKAGIVTPVSTTQSAGYAINNAGSMVGTMSPQSSPNTTDATIWPPSGAPIDLTPGNAFSVGLSINAAGSVIGAAQNSATPATLDTYIFRPKPLDLTKLGPPGSHGISSLGATINGYGHAAFTEVDTAAGRYRSFFYNGTALLSILPFGTDKAAVVKGLNRTDRVVGYSCADLDQTQCGPFLYDNRKSVALRSLIPSSYNLRFAARYGANVAIADDGTILVVAAANAASGFNSQVLKLTP